MQLVSVISSIAKVTLRGPHSNGGKWGALLTHSSTRSEAFLSRSEGSANTRLHEELPAQV
jgi:hypothetical protein